MILAARGVGKRYAAFDAVADVDLTIGAGEFISIVGRSGSGKSTLLAMLGALTPPGDGEVTLDVQGWYQPVGGGTDAHPSGGSRFGSCAIARVM